MTLDPARSAARPARRTLLAAALALALLAGLVAAGLVGRSVLAARADDARGQDAVAAATQLGVNFTTIDYRTFDADAARVVAGATGTFKNEFTAQSAQLKTLVTQNRSVTQGSVLSAALVSHDADSARVLLVLDAAVTNTSATSPVPRHYRIQLDLARSGSTWRTDQLEFVG